MNIKKFWSIGKYLLHGVYYQKSSGKDTGFKAVYQSRQWKQFHGCKLSYFSAEKVLNWRIALLLIKFYLPLLNQLQCFNLKSKI